MTGVSERYLLLGLRVGRHVEGIVDAYYGPPELATAVDTEPLVEPAELVAEAAALLREVPHGWLRDQLSGLRTYAEALGGASRSYADEVEGCYGVRPIRTDESVFAAAHEELAALLPGSGSVAERYAAWETSTRMPADAIEPTLAAVIEEARAQTRTLVELPDGEDVELVVEHDKPWWAFCDYHGDLRSTITVNVDLPMTAIELLRIAMHETYPGHHVERACKEEALVRGRGLLEETLLLVPTPQSLVTEGIAVLAPRLLLEGDGGERLASIVREAGVDLDLAHALAIERAHEPLRWAEVNAALMLHVDGAGDTETQAYLERWGLLNDELAAHVIRFLREPTSRTYIVTYPAGRDLCRAWVGDDSARFRRLLTEQVTVGELAASKL